MRLRKLEIQGFKSFADRTVIHFDSGITIVVGPNGCGKSNVVDALRWCMGEQSAKHLRGDGMQDVIFNGSDARGPSGLAEVSLTFINEGDVSGEFSAYPEITITRRLYRSGDSEYLINKNQVRLKDVQDIILGTGVGTKGYSIIEQGRIGMIVSSKAEDRQRLIEEAAGITKYKARRQAAERKMDATRHNLQRVGDVVTELGKRLGVLRRQAAKAEKFRTLRGELRELELHDASVEHLRLLSMTEYERGALGDMEEHAAGMGARLAVLDADAEIARLQLLEDEKKIQQLQTMIYAVDQEIRLAEQKAVHNQASAASLQKRAEDAEHEMTSQKGRILQMEEEKVHLHDELERLKAEVENSDTITAQSSTELEELKCERDDLAALLDENKRVVGNLRNDETAAASVLAQLARRGAEMFEREARLREEQENLDAEADAVINSKRMGQTSVELRREEKIQLEVQRKRLVEQLQVEGEKLRLAVQRANTVQEELGRKRNRLHGLEEVHNSLARAPEGVRTVVEWGRSDPSLGVMGLLADAWETPAHLEAAVAGALSHYLDDIVVESVDHAVTLAGRLRKQQKGRAAFLPRVPKTPAPSRAPVQSDGVVGWLADEIKIQPGLEGAVHARLGNVLVVKDLQTALTLHGSGLAARIVTLQGDFIDVTGEVVGGSADEATQTYLRQRREITELTEDVTRLDASMRDADDVRAEAASLVENLQREEKDAAEESQTVALRLLEAEKDLHRLTEQAVKLTSRRDALMEDLTRTVEINTELRLEERTNQETLERAKAERETLERDLQVNAERHQILSSQYMQASERATELRVRLQTAKDRRDQLERTLGNGDKMREDVESLIERLQQQAENARKEGLRLLEESAAEQANALTKSSEVGSVKGILEEQRTAYEAAQTRVAGLESEARGLRGSATSAQNKLMDAKVSLRENELALKHLHERILEVYQITLNSVLVDYHLRALPVDSAGERMTDLRRQIDNMGEINLTAIDECKDVEDRHTFLCNQQDDLTHALHQLEKAITKINKTTKRRFQEAFEGINAKFQEVFPRLFRGGKAWLQMTNPEDLLETGIEIFAQPPGKKVSTVQLLSGGEKALTAVSLVFSIFLIKPSPFCLLDEVDAPLDEANVARFNELVRDVAGISQFIIITHNKRTMEIADNIYGITMEEPGISKLVNVRVNLADLQARAKTQPPLAAPTVDAQP